jgi:hypothetical protein
MLRHLDLNSQPLAQIPEFHNGFEFLTHPSILAHTKGGSRKRSRSLESRRARAGRSGTSDPERPVPALASRSARSHSPRLVGTVVNGHLRRAMTPAATLLWFRF